MRAVVQRVREADVTVEGSITGAIERGLMVLLGVEDGDDESDARYMADKISGLRIFEDSDGKMNLSVKDVFGDVRKGKRPSFSKAARPEEARRLYRYFIDLLSEGDIEVQEGIFQAEMMVRILNDGPVTILLDSKKLF